MRDNKEEENRSLYSYFFHSGVEQRKSFKNKVSDGNVCLQCPPSPSPRELFPHSMVRGGELEDESGCEFEEALMRSTVGDFVSWWSSFGAGEAEYPGW